MWIEVLGFRAAAGALLDRLTHHGPHPGNERGQLPVQEQPGRRKTPARKYLFTGFVRRHALGWGLGLA